MLLKMLNFLYMAFFYSFFSESPTYFEKKSASPNHLWILSKHGGNMIKEIRVFAACCTMFMICFDSFQYELGNMLSHRLLKEAQRTMSIFKIDLCKSTQRRCKTSASINMKFQLHKGHEASWWFNQPI